MNPVLEEFSQLKGLTSSTVFNSFALKNTIQKLSNLMQSSQNRNAVEPHHWQDIVHVCSIGVQVINQKEFKENDLEFLAIIFRFLRNACGGSGRSHIYLLNSPECVEFIHLPLRILLHKKEPKEITVLKICIQLFGNLLVLNERAKPLVWKYFFKESAFKSLLCSPDPTVQEYTMMVLYNSMSDNHCNEILTTNDGHDIVKAVTDSLLKNFVDWGMLFIECLLKREEFQYCYTPMPLENRLLILDIITEHLKSIENEETLIIPFANIEYFKRSFITLVEKIAVLYSVNENMEPSEFVKILSLLCTASVCNAYILYMHSCKDLLEKCIETLKCVHLLGKDGSNVFSSISSSKILSAQCDEQIASHPLFGFKKDLVKLIGNLCYGCKENQDLVRKLDGIPLVLDCCKLDAKNPYIMQWCILAIRNIVHQNEENQAILAGITTTGEIEDSSFLKEIGINVRYKDGKLSLS
nr:ataxin-10 isoform X1 [Parasteatoda tepidariorum]